MKKTSAKVSALTLNRDTLRSLTSAELRHVAGGSASNQNGVEGCNPNGSNDGNSGNNSTVKEPGGGGGRTVLRQQ